MDPVVKSLGILPGAGRRGGNSCSAALRQIASAQARGAEELLRGGGRVGARSLARPGAARLARAAQLGRRVSGQARWEKDLLRFSGRGQTRRLEHRGSGTRMRHPGTEGERSGARSRATGAGWQVPWGPKTVATPRACLRVQPGNGERAVRKWPRARASARRAWLEAERAEERAAARRAWSETGIAPRRIAARPA